MVNAYVNWVTYDNIKRKRSCSNCGEPAAVIAKPGLTSKKFLLGRKSSTINCCLYCQTPNSDLYCQQSDESHGRKRPALANRRGFVIDEDNAKAHTFIVTLARRSWRLVERLLCRDYCVSYSPDLKPSHVVMNTVYGE